MKRTAPGLFVVLTLLTACASTGGSPGDSGGGGSGSPPDASGSEEPAANDGIEHPTGADEPILTVEDTGGFVMVQTIATRTPSFILMGDGRVIMQGMQTLEFPGPALPALIERTMNEDGIQAVLEAVEDTGLFTSDLKLDGAMQFIADATDTIFRLNANGREVTISVYGLGLLDPEFGGNFEGIDPAEVDAHAVLSQLRDALMAIDTSVPGDSWEVEGWQPYQPEAFRLYVRDVTGEAVEGGDLPEQVREWPTEDDPTTFGEADAIFGDGTRCGVVEGEVAATWLAELNLSTQMTLWTTDGDDRFSVLPRPVLPGEEAVCPEVAPGG